MDPDHISYRANSDAFIFMKSADTENLWYASINGKSGFVNPTFLRETKIYVKNPEIIRPVMVKKEPEGLVQPDKVQQAHEVIEGTTIYSAEPTTEFVSTTEVPTNDSPTTTIDNVDQGESEDPNNFKDNTAQESEDNSDTNSIIEEKTDQITTSDEPTDLQSSTESVIVDTTYETPVSLTPIDNKKETNIISDSINPVLPTILSDTSAQINNPVSEILDHVPEVVDLIDKTLSDPSKIELNYSNNDVIETETQKPTVSTEQDIQKELHGASGAPSNDINVNINSDSQNENVDESKFTPNLAEEVDSNNEHTVSEEKDSGYLIPSLDSFSSLLGDTTVSSNEIQIDEKTESKIFEDSTQSLNNPSTLSPVHIETVTEISVPIPIPEIPDVPNSDTLPLKIPDTTNPPEIQTPSEKPPTIQEQKPNQLPSPQSPLLENIPPLYQDQSVPSPLGTLPPIFSNKANSQEQSTANTNSFTTEEPIKIDIYEITTPEPSISESIDNILTSTESPNIRISTDATYDTSTEGTKDDSGFLSSMYTTLADVWPSTTEQPPSLFNTESQPTFEEEKVDGKSFSFMSYLMSTYYSIMGVNEDIRALFPSNGEYIFKHPITLS